MKNLIPIHKKGVFMYLILVGYVLGLFTMFAIYLHKSKKIHFAWYQWVLLATALVVFMYSVDKYVSLELKVATQTFGYTFRMFFVPFIIILGLIFILPIFVKRMKKTKENKEVE